MENGLKLSKNKRLGPKKIDDFPPISENEKFAHRVVDLARKIKPPNPGKQNLDP